MLDEAGKTNVLARLSRIEGQVRGVRRMVEKDQYCVDVLAQTRSIAGALRSVEHRVLEAHLQTCVADAMRSKDHGAQELKVKEVLSVIVALRKGA